MASFSPEEMQYLRTLSYRFPTPEAALAELAHLRAVLALPRGTVHVVSDVHGEYRKLEHILRNASGSLRALVARVFDDVLSASAQRQLLNFIYYPRETFTRLALALPAEQARAMVRNAIANEFVLLRVLAARYTLRHAERLFPKEYASLFREFLFSPPLGRSQAYLDALLEPFLNDDHGLQLLREVARTLRSFSVFELIVAGDLGDRGPRIDRVFEALRNQRNVTVLWGNHDAEWLGACLGQQALIATVLRVSLRYGRISQLEEGYGIPVEPIEQLVRAVYSNDPAERFHPKGEDLRDSLLLARMQKAMTVLQCKLEGQTARRNPHFGLEDRCLLHRIDLQEGTIELDGVKHPLLDRSFPTLQPSDPYALTEAEAHCMEHLTQSFLQSSSLWRDMRFLVDRGAMWTARDEHLLFHGCVPCDANGTFLDFPVDGTPVRGRALFDALERVVRRAVRKREERDVDLLYYLWAGPRSPLFGKDKMATFETYFLADKKTHKETKNPYFELLHERGFCWSLAREFGVDPERVLVVNGHVPVKLETGEKPLKRSGHAVTIDGAFSEAYGDKGYTLVLEAERTYLAQHHHFGSVEEAIEQGKDIVPITEDLRVYPTPRLVHDTPRGEELRREIQGLERLVVAYRDHGLTSPSL